MLAHCHRRSLPQCCIGQLMDQDELHQQGFELWNTIQFYPHLGTSSELNKRFRASAEGRATAIAEATAVLLRSQPPAATSDDDRHAAASSARGEAAA